MRKTHQWNTEDVPSCDLSYVNEHAVTAVPQQTVVDATYELCELLEDALLQSNRVLSFESRIAVTSNELMAVIQNCCQKVIDKLALRVTMAITIQGTLVQIRW